MFGHTPVKIIRLTYIKGKILHTLKDVNKEFFLAHAETEGFVPTFGTIQFPVYTLSPDRRSGLLQPPGQVSLTDPEKNFAPGSMLQYISGSFDS